MLMLSKHSTEQRFRLLKENLDATLASEGDNLKIRWILAASALLLADNAWTTTTVVPFLDATTAKWWPMVLGIIEAQSELCLVATRFLALMLLFSGSWPRSVLHVHATSNEGKEIFSVLVAIAKTRDPMLLPSTMLALEALVMGPQQRLSAQLLATEAADDIARMTLQWLGVAELRQVACKILEALMSAKEGVRLLQLRADDVSLAIHGTSLEREWLMVRHSQ